MEFGLGNCLGRSGACVCSGCQVSVGMKPGLVFIRPAGEFLGVEALALLLAPGPDAIQSHPGFYSLLQFFHRS